MTKIIVLGAGMVGSVIAADLAKQHHVTSADLNEVNLIKAKNRAEGNLQTIIADLSKKEVIANLVIDFDLVVCAVPGFMGFETVKTVIESGKNVVDISFFPENAFDLDDLAKEKNVTAIVDCGVAPGMGNIILGYLDKKYDVRKFECYVCGLPNERKLPFQYKAPFSPIDVIEEYTREARFVKEGKIVTTPALTGREFKNFANIGTLEAFYTDGLRSLLYTMKVPDMSEKTMRYPGHIDLMEILRESGFFSKELLTLKQNIQVAPLDVTTKLLFPLWKLEEEESEFTLMEVKVLCDTEFGLTQFIYNLFDTYDPITKASSMARTTGYTCTAAVDLVLKNKFTRKGINPPEYIGAEQGCFKEVLKYLKERGVVYKQSGGEEKYDYLTRLID